MGRVYIYIRVYVVSAAILLTISITGCSSAGSYVTSTPNPLVAAYNIPVPSGAQTWVEFGPDTNYGRQTSPLTAAPGSTMVQILVAGMLPSTPYHMRAHIQYADGTTSVDRDWIFATGVVPASLKPPSMTVSQPNSNLSPAPGVELLSTIGTNGLQGIVTDLKGNIIWYCPGAALPLKPLPNGHFIFNRTTSLQELDLACNTIRAVSVAQVKCVYI